MSEKSSASMKCIQATEHFDSMLLTRQNNTAASGRSSASVLTLQATEHFDSMLLTPQNNTAVSGRSSASVLTPQATEHFDSMLFTPQRSAGPALAESPRVPGAAVPTPRRASGTPCPSPHARLCEGRPHKCLPPNWNTQSRALGQEGV